MMGTARTMKQHYQELLPDLLITYKTYVDNTANILLALILNIYFLLVLILHMVSCTDFTKKSCTSKVKQVDPVGNHVETSLIMFDQT